MSSVQTPDVLGADVGLLAAIRKNLVLVVVTTLVFATGGYFLAKALPKEYSADAVVTVARPDTLPVYRTVSAGDASNRQLTIANQLHDSRTLGRVAAAVHSTAAKLADRVTVTPEPQTSLIDVSATASDPSTAAQVANGVVAAYLAVAAADQAQQTARDVAPLSLASSALQRQIDTLTGQVTTRAAKLRDEVATEFAGSSSVVAGAQDRALQAALQADPLYSSLRAAITDKQVQRDALMEKIHQVQVDGPLMAQVFSGVDPAHAPTTADGLTPTRAAVLGGLVGLLVGCALAWRRAERRRPLSPGAAARLAGSPVLAELFPSRRALRGVGRLGTFAAADGRLAAMALVLVRFRQARELECLVVAPATNEPTGPAVALALATATACAGSLCMLVDATAGGELTTVADLGGQPGFRDVAAGGGDLAENSQVVNLAGAPVQFVPVGTGQEPQESLSVTSLSAHDTVRVPLIVAAPGLDASGRALGLVGDRGALVLVTGDRSDPAALAALRTRLDLAGLTVAGIVHVHGRLRSARSGRRHAAEQPADATNRPTTQVRAVPASHVRQP